jgi:hypothetical protein
MTQALRTETRPTEKWRPIANAPFDQDLELAVLERDDAHALAFACRRTDEGWIDIQNGQYVDVNPTHWRAWRNPL